MTQAQQANGRMLDVAPAHSPARANRIYRITDPLSRGRCDVGPGVVAVSAWIP
jgi:hypothetical protein